jgi:hypothetical protein
MNFILKERRLNFSAEKPFADYLKAAPFSSWWSLYEFVRTHFIPSPLRGEGMGEG